MRKTFLVLVIIMISSPSYAMSFSIPAQVCFANRIGATGCIGAVVLFIYPTPVTLIAYAGSLLYSVYSYDKSVNDCKEDEISMAKIKMAKEEVEKQISNVTVARYNALNQIFNSSNLCQSRSEFHKIHNGQVYGEISYTNDELDIIFDYILKMGEVDIGEVDENDLWD